MGENEVSAGDVSGDAIRNDQWLRQVALDHAVKMNMNQNFSGPDVRAKQTVEYAEQFYVFLTGPMQS